MSRILALAKSGFGKTFGMGKIDELGHIGLNPSETFLISTTTKDLTFPNWNKDYKTTTPDKLNEGNRVMTNDPDIISDILIKLAHPKSPFKIVVIDDFNYIMQDYYMDNAMKGGWDTPKKIGYFMGKVFKAIETFKDSDKHIIILAHSEEVDMPDGRKLVKMKTTGRMVDEYITPEGKVDITLVGKGRWDSTNKKSIREFITNEEEFYVGAKSGYGMFPLYIPNDFGYIVEQIDRFKGGN